MRGENAVRENNDEKGNFVGAHERTPIILATTNLQKQNHFINLTFEKKVSGFYSQAVVESCIPSGAALTVDDCSSTLLPRPHYLRALNTFIYAILVVKLVWTTRYSYG